MWRQCTLHHYRSVKLTWDVQQHCEQQDVVVAEREVQFVWHLQAPQLLVGYI
jgi:hypothetical protein